VSAFRNPWLQSAEFKTGRIGPKSIEGQRAVVFFADTVRGPVAVRCLKEPLPDGAKRYLALRAYLADNPVAAITPAEWTEDGINVAEARWPIVTMERVPGPSLLTFVEKNLHEPLRLAQLAADWRALITELSRASIAHGDLQQDNILLADGQHLRLVDLDAIWIPPLAHMPAPAERGHRHFQHPKRTRRGYWGRYMDTFPALVIYVSLLALAADPGLFNEFNNDQNLIFSYKDLAEPGRTALWPRLWASPDLNLRNLVTVLERCCRTTAELAVDLDTLLGTAATGPKLVRSPPWLTPVPAQAPRVVIGRPIERDDAAQRRWKPEPAPQAPPSVVPMPVSPAREPPAPIVPGPRVPVPQPSRVPHPVALAILVVILVLAAALILVVVV